MKYQSQRAALKPVIEIHFARSLVRPFVSCFIARARAPANVLENCFNAPLGGQLERERVSLTKKKRERRREERELEGRGGETGQKFSNWMNCQAPRVKLQLSQLLVNSPTVSCSLSMTFRSCINDSPATTRPSVPNHFLQFHSDSFFPVFFLFFFELTLLFDNCYQTWFLGQLVFDDLGL